MTSLVMLYMSNLKVCWRHMPSHRGRFFAVATAARRVPEGPEVTSLADGLMDYIVTTPRKNHKRVSIVKANIVSGRYLDSTDPAADSTSKQKTQRAKPAEEEEKAPAGWRDLLRQLPLEILSVKNKGKFLFFELSDGVSLWSTLGMSGGWTLQRHHHSRIELHIEHDNVLIEERNNGGNDTQDNVGSSAHRLRQILTFYDSRNFGTFKACFKDTELQERLSRLGPSWAHDEVSLDHFRKLLQKGGKPQQRRLLAVFLMDQTKTSGIGNYILAEVLYAARIHPWARVGDVAVNDDLTACLHGAIREVSLSSLAAQRDSAARRAGLPSLPGLRTYGAFDGRKRGYKGCGSSFDLKVYGRKYCPRGLPVLRDNNGPHKRTIHWVPEWQVLGSSGYLF